jgi:hypothetical protein
MWSNYANELITPAFNKFEQLKIGAIPLLKDGKNDSLFRLKLNEKIRKAQCKKYKVLINGEMIDDLCIFCNNLIKKSFIDNAQNCNFANDSEYNFICDETSIYLIQGTLEIPLFLLTPDIFQMPELIKLDFTAKRILHNLSTWFANKQRFYNEMISKDDYHFNWYFTKKLTEKPIFDAYLLKMNALYKKLSKYNEKELQKLMSEMKI